MEEGTTGVDTEADCGRHGTMNQHGHGGVEMLNSQSSARRHRSERLESRMRRAAALGASNGIVLVVTRVRHPLQNVQFMTMFTHLFLDQIVAPLPPHRVASLPLGYDMLDGLVWAARYAQASFIRERHVAVRKDDIYSQQDFSQPTLPYGVASTYTSGMSRAKI